MKELDAIVKELKAALEAKGSEIKAAGDSAIKPVTDAFRVRQREVISFEQSTLHIKDESVITPARITQFRSDSQEILFMIRRLVV